MSDAAVSIGLVVSTPERAGLTIGARLGLVAEVVAGGFVELWAHKLRSILTLTLLMLGVFALVVMTSVMDGVMDKVSTGFAGMSWDGTVLLEPRSPETTEQQKRFAMSPGLRFEDLPRLTSPDKRIVGFLPRATRRTTVRVPGGTERIFVTGSVPDYFPLMSRIIGSGRALTEDDIRRRNRVAVAGATLASKLYGGTNPLGRDIVVEGVSYRIVGILASAMIFNDWHYMEANGLLIPLTTYMDRIDPSHQLDAVAVKLRARNDIADVSSLMLARARQSHHGIEDVQVQDLDAQGARAYQRFLDEVRGWRIVLTSLAATVLLVGGVGVLSVMLISFADRRYEIGLRKAMGATDTQVLVQFLLEALVLAAIGATIGTVAGAVTCKALSPVFPWGLVVNRSGLVMAWGVALLLALVFGLYPALKAKQLSPMAAMR